MWSMVVLPSSLRHGYRNDFHVIHSMVVKKVYANLIQLDDTMDNLDQ